MNYQTNTLAILTAVTLAAAACGDDPPGGDQSNDASDNTGGDATVTADAGDTTDQPGDADDGDQGDATADDAGDDPSTRTVTLDISNSPVALPQLGDDYTWEGWLITPDDPVSTGRFDAAPDKSKYEFQVDASTTDEAERFVLTIEPASEDDPAPSSTKYLAGELGDSSAQLSIASTIGDFSGASGVYTLNAPTAEDPASSATHGIWFLEPGEPPTAGFDGLPELDGKGWVYEGWVVDTNGEQPQPYTTGKFADAAESWTMADRDGAGPSAGPNPDAAPDLPGSDFLGGGEAGNDFDLTAGGNWRAVLSVEPIVDGADTSPDPFVVKPFSAKIQSDTETNKARSLNLKTDQLPSGKVEID